MYQQTDMLTFGFHHSNHCSCTHKCLLYSITWHSQHIITIDHLLLLLMVLLWTVQPGHYTFSAFHPICFELCFAKKTKNIPVPTCIILIEPSITCNVLSDQ